MGVADRPILQGNMEHLGLETTRMTTMTPRTKTPTTMEEVLLFGQETQETEKSPRLTSILAHFGNGCRCSSISVIMNIALKLRSKECQI
jgi:hypothetical protein